MPQQQPYGYPQQAPPPPHQGGWGGPGAPGGGPGAAGWPPQGPQPPRKKRTGLIVGIVACAVLVATGVVYGVSQLADKGADLAFPKAEYKLVVVKKPLGDEFTLEQDMSDTEGKEIEDTPDPSVRDGKAVVAHYSSTKGDALVLSGIHGRLASPSLMRGMMLKGAADEGDSKVVVPVKKFTPDGYDVTIECQVVQSKDVGGLVNMPMCAWADSNTAAMIALFRPGYVLKDATDIDLAKVAEDTAKVRGEVRQPIG